jgi:hypothetical protein
MEKVDVISVSQVAKTIEVEDYPPLEDNDLVKIIDESKYGIAFHDLFSIPDDEPLPIHIHPKTLISMVQEIEASRVDRHRVSLLETALEEYGKHKSDCLLILWPTMHSLQKNILEYGCTCGLDEIKG